MAWLCTYIHVAKCCPCYYKLPVRVTMFAVSWLVGGLLLCIIPFTTSSLKITPVTDGVVQDRGIAHTQWGDVSAFVSIPHIDRDSLRTIIPSLVDDAMQTLATIALLRNGSKVGEVKVQVLRERLECVRVNSRRPKSTSLDPLGSPCLVLSLTRILKALQKTMTENQGQMTDFVTANNKLIGVVNQMNHDHFFQQLREEMGYERAPEDR
ncbi:hypothetical protein CAPTEDRAFT_188470 [Capitella teleta]|uniref:Uncharacterized protein n=1 Tax=Capitella teleta TaxID=283909 RepID=R7U1V5_CAPTE|nr:hypothetical protein CAPTEDRAFT_188470 [Capitella teleta]|eukprot:ELT99969.1 hypothetical protein CAPTEDRAFT_188470 [Capitella teleta]